MQNASELEAQGKRGAAIIEYKNILQSDPKNSAARLSLAGLYLSEGEGAAAEKELLAATDGVPTGTIIVDLAQARVLAGRFDSVVMGDAEGSLAQIALVEGLQSVEKARLKALHGQAFLATSKIDDAEQLFSAALADAQNEPYALLGRAMIQYSAGKQDEALATLGKARAADPKFAPAWSLTGDIQRAQGNLREAKDAYTKAINLRGNIGRDLLERALVRVALDDSAGAAQDARRLAGLPGGRTASAYIRGLLAFRKGEFDQAEQAFRAALASDGGYMPAILYAGLTAAGLGHLEQAREFLLRYTLAFPRNATALTQLASVLTQLEDFGAARATIERALEISPEDKVALGLLGTIEFAMGNPDSAGVVFTRLIQQAPDDADAYLKLGAVLVAEGKQDAASQALEKATELQVKDESNPEARIRALLTQGKQDEALVAAETLTQERPDSAAFLLLGQVYMVKNELDQAGTALGRSLELDPENLRALHEQGRLAMLRNEPEKAVDALTRVVKAEPKNLAAVLSLVEALARLNRSTEAVEVLEAARASDPNAWQPRLLLARHYRSNGSVQQGLSLLLEIAEDNRDNGPFLLELGQAQLAVGHTDKSIETLTHLVRLAPRSPIAHYRLAEALSAVGLLDEAKDSLVESLRLKPDFIEPKIVLARMAMAVGDIETAAPLIDGLAESQPDNVDAQLLVAGLAMRRSDSKGAVRAYEKVMSLGPSGSSAVALALARASDGDGDGAMAGLESWLRDHPDDHGARLSFANLALVLKRMDTAKQHYFILVSRGAASPGARNNLAQILLEEGDVEGALSNAMAALELAPENPQFHDSLALIHLRRQDPSAALSALDHALALAPGNVTLLLHQAIALAAMDRFDEADAVVGQILETGGQSPEVGDARALRTRIQARTASTGGVQSQ